MKTFEEFRETRRLVMNSIHPQAMFYYLGEYVPRGPAQPEASPLEKNDLMAVSDEDDFEATVDQFIQGARIVVYSSGKFSVLITNEEKIFSSLDEAEAWLWNEWVLPEWFADDVRDECMKDLNRIFEHKMEGYKV